MPRPAPPAILGLLVVAACATPVGVERVDDQTSHRALSRNVLSAGEPSSFSKSQLLRLGLWDRYGSDPEDALAALHAELGSDLDDRLLFALAELSFQQGQKTGSHTRYLAAALYAYAFLFPDSVEPPGPFDARTRLALDLYNRGIAEGFEETEAGAIALHGGTFEVPFGTLELESDPDAFSWGEHRFAGFTSLARFEVRGLRNRYRRPGIGAALAGSLEREQSEDATERSLRIPPALQVPVTVLIRFEAPRRSVRAGRVHGRLELFAEHVAPSVTVAGRAVPLEYDPTAALAYTLEHSEAWAFEKRGYLSGSYRSDVDGLYALQPYSRGRVPVVLVHGTASSPARWAELLNELMGDPLIDRRCQLWLFMYNTGNPILYSASLLRQALRGAVRELDPEGRDPALRDMVLIGHSQGGVIVRLMVTDSGDRFWNAVATKPLAELDVSDATRDLLQRSLFFEPVASVKRVIFISTPHAGSFVAGNRLGRMAARLVRMPVNLAQTGAEILTDNRDALAMRDLERLPSSVDNMDPEHPFSVTLAASPIAPGVAVHSIIPVKGDGPPFAGLDDGVVQYDSAHVEGVESEFVIERTGHSAQGTPPAIEEVRRILRLHLEQR